MDEWMIQVEPRLEQAKLKLPQLQNLAIACANHALLVAEQTFWTDFPPESWASFRAILDAYWKWIEDGRPANVASFRKMFKAQFREQEEDEEERPGSWGRMSDGLIEALSLVIGDQETGRSDQERAANSMLHSYETLLEEEISENMEESSYHESPGDDPVAQSVERLFAMSPERAESKSDVLAREIEFQLAAIERIQSGRPLRRQDALPRG